MASIAVSFQVLPVGLVEKTTIYAAVDAAISVVTQSGLHYLVNPMETTIEGEYDTVMAVIKQAQDAVIATGARSVFTYIKIDYNPNGSTIDEKLENYRDT